MKTSLFSFFLLFSLLANAQKGEIIQKNAVVEKAGSGYSFTEGPAEAYNGRVYFTDQP